MRIVMAGSSGLIGSRLVRHLEQAGHTVTRLLRHDGAAGATWDPQRGILDPAVIDGCDAVINLAGAGIADARWSEARKQLILHSRTATTSLLARTIAQVAHQPRVFLQTSAVGIYGDGGDTRCDENSPAGASGFLPEVAVQWERAAEPAGQAGVRTVLARLGVVFDRSGGMLARLVPVFNLGLGGRVGSGRQFISWITTRDLLRACDFLLDPGCTLHGPVNVCSPNPVRNADFARALAHVLRRPALIPLPAFVISLVFGQMGRETVLGGQRALPRALTDAGFRFEDSDLDVALGAVLA